MESNTEKPNNDTAKPPGQTNPILVTNKSIPVKSSPLTTKKSIELLLTGTLKNRVCKSCLNVTPALTSLSQVLEVAKDGVFYKISIKDMIASFHPCYEISEDCKELPNKICNKCLNRTINAYLFNQQYKQSDQALQNCFKDVYENVIVLDPLDKESKPGRRKLHVNYNVLKVTHKYVKDYAKPLIQLVKSGSLIDNSDIVLNKNECPKCWEVLPNLASLIRHEKTHPKAMWFRCRYCGLSFARKVMYNRHIKVHISQSSTQLDQIKKVENKFKCTTCDTISDNYIYHLQHLEKHKFKETLQNILAKKDLCAVCLEDGKDMVNVDKTVALHGGYQDLMVDCSLDTILPSVLPDRPNKRKLSFSYKYQELLIPKPAKIIRITPRKLKKDKTSRIKVKDFKNRNDCNNENNSPKNRFKFNEPNIITSIINLNGNNVTFVFSKPKELDLKEIQDNHADNEIEKIARNVAMDKNNTKTDKSIDSDAKLSTINDEMNVITSKVAVKECNYCWLFAKVNKCDVCKKTAQDKVLSDHPLTSDEKSRPDVTSEIRTKMIKSVKGVIHEKWQCTVCLTTNASETKCVCCESEKRSNDVGVHIKTFDFPKKQNNSNIFNDSNKKDNTDVIKLNRSEKEVNIVKKKIPHEKHSEEMKSTEYANIEKFEDNIIPKYFFSSSTELYHLESEKDTSDIMDICEDELEANSAFPKAIRDSHQDVKTVEEMSVDQDEIVVNDALNKNNLQMPSMMNDDNENCYTSQVPFQFNIGISSNIKERRIKKPIRRVTSHK